MLEEIQKHNWKPFPHKRKTHFFSTVGSKGPCASFHNQCSWCIGLRWSNKGSLCFGDPTILPQTIFIASFHFKFFYKNIYPYIPSDHKYIIIIADEDATIPTQLDCRYPRDRIFNINEWQHILDNKNILHIFASHLDIPATDRFSPIPVGFNPEECPSNNIDSIMNIHIDLDIMNRPLKVLHTCRIREGNQWNQRKQVKYLVEGPWNKFSEYKSIPKENYFKEIQKYSFILCVHGGGLEPNPKVFTALYCGTIPIVKRFVNCDILYKDLPVVFVDDWEPNSITLPLLNKWREELISYFIYPKRELAIEKLTTQYWIDKIEAYFLR